MKEILIEFGSLALAVSSAIIAVINAIVSARRSYKLSQELDAAKERETYITDDEYDLILDWLDGAKKISNEQQIYLINGEWENLYISIGDENKNK